MKINIIGSGWLAQPLAKELKAVGDDVLLTATHAGKVKDLSAHGFNAIQYQLGDAVQSSDPLFDADVLIIAITSKDIAGYSELLSQLDSSITQHLIFISSTSVYKNCSEAHDETSQQLNRANPLVKIEQIISSHPKATIIRFAGLVGPGRHPGRFFESGKPIKNPQARVNLIHLNDCIGIIKAIIKQQSWGEIFNGCADNHPKKGEFYPTMAKQLGLPKPKTANTHAEASDKIVKNKKIKTQLKYVFKFPDVYHMTFE